jgi:glycosyltransferase involved in cell wall biosynthesis
MRLMVVSRRYPPDQFSGTETVIANVVERARRRHEVRLVAGWRQDPTLLPADARKVRLAGVPKPVGWARLARAASEEARSFRPDVVLSNSIETPTGLAPTVTIVYDFNFGSSRRLATAQLRGAFYRFQSRRLAKVVVISEATRRFAIERGFPADKLEVIYPGVDVDRFRPDPDLPALPPAGEPTVLAYPSRILPGKAQHLAIEAFSKLPEPWRQRAELRIVGAVADEEYLAELRRAAAGLNVSFHTDVADIVPHYRSAHLILFPTMMEEGFGYTAAEGMACGKPVVHFRCAAVDEACAGAAVGVPAGDTSAMAAAVGELMGDAERCAALGRAGRRRVEQAFSWDAIWARYREVLFSIAR